MTRAKAKAKAKAIWMPAKERPRRRDSGSRSLDAGASPSESLQKHETLRQASPSGQPQRVSITDSYGASPRHRPWITPQGATPAKRIQLNTHPEGLKTGHNCNH